jgi:two-component system alkaline phosphatase synthesis response regulator PhoP
VADAKPDLILLDIMMPKLSGFEVCRKLKANPATRDIPICMVTALNEEGDIERAVEAGTDDFLSKPINKWELLTRVRSLLRVRHLQSELERTLSYLEEVDQARGPADED